LFGSYAYGKPTDKSDKEEDVIYALNAVERIRNIEPIQNSRNFLIRENKTQDDVKETAINNDVLPNCA
ncbi:MAG: hypothetical protein LBN92_01550, partial [Treponema sp.]|nr:hypothetical protein [Treponema sp.]